jgi:hypothetical protein
MIKKIFSKVLIFSIVFLGSTMTCMASSDTLTFSVEGISFNGRIQSLPCSQDDIISLFGSPSETVYAAGDELSRTVIEWSHIGVFAWVKPSTGIVDGIGISISPAHPERGFEKSFSGAIFVNGTRLSLTKAGFKLAGFSRSSKHANWKQDLGNYYMTVVTESPDDPREIEFGVRSDD